MIKPISKEELRKLIKTAISRNGIGADLNYIDTSEITDMSELFLNSEFNGKIDMWNTENVENMYCMFVLMCS